MNPINKHDEKYIIINALFSAVIDFLLLFNSSLIYNFYKNKSLFGQKFS